MANNFRKTGNAYISKDGNDANSGLSAELPKQTLAFYSTAENVVGCGEYKGAFSFARGIFVPDGTCKINATANIASTVADASFTVRFGRTTERNANFYIALNGFSFIATIGTHAFYDVVLLGGGLTKTNNTLLFVRTILESVNATVSGNAVTTMNYCKVFNSIVTARALTSVITDCYFDEASILSMPLGYFTTPSTGFKNNNFGGLVNVGGINYELKLDKGGIPIPARVSNGINDLATIDATVYTRGNFYQDPAFLNLAKGDFWSVDSTSPMLFADTTALASIGYVWVATVKKATDTEFSSPASIEDLQSSLGDYYFDPASLDDIGSVLSQPIQIANAPAKIKHINLAGLLAFNSLQTIGGAENTSVPAVENYLAGTAGANPRRLTYEMRWSNQSAMPASPVEWDNNMIITAGDFAKFEHNSIPLIDNMGKGNGEPDFNQLSSGSIQAKWIQVKIYLLKGIG
jgi:hypothetical protein